MSDGSVLTTFQEDTIKLASKTEEFVDAFFPAYGTTKDAAIKATQRNSLGVLNSLTLYQVCECTISDVDDRIAFFAGKMEKLFTAAFSVKEAFCYGIVSDERKTSLVIGVGPKSNDQTVKTLIEGFLPGIRIEKYDSKFVNSNDEKGQEKKRYGGCISGVPVAKINDEYKPKDISALMRSLNGQNYTVLVMCKPLDELEIQNKINAAIEIQDECFAISKRTISLQQGSSNANTHSEDYHEADGINKGKNRGVNVNGAVPGALAGAGAGALVGSIVPGIGTAVGAIGGGLIGLITGKQISFSSGKSEGEQHTTTKGYSDAVTETITKNESISGDVQNGFAIELMKMAESVIERLKIGRSIGMWNSVVSYSSDSEFASNILQGILYEEIASGQPDVLPPVVMPCLSDINDRVEHLMIPYNFFEDDYNGFMCSMVTSEELSGICTIPNENTVGFGINEAKAFSLNAITKSEDKVIGNLCEYDRVLENAHFGISKDDINKHLFVCGMTGYGKTNTVKKILMQFDTPYLVIEPAKKEYRNIKTAIAPTIYTLGRPEINCIRINPFYIIPGTSPQQHIDLLKDLFSASFAFYGPMPYIFEKCLNNIYVKRGWNLTLGFHPALVEKSNNSQMFSADKVKEKYSISAHKYLFPTMQDLKNEIDYYIENELSYEGEIKGNIRSAIKSRIDSLCIGTKGYMFNCNEIADFDTLFKTNAVIELEGMADDDDKAFALGLLIIFINEYRQMHKETDDVSGLRHILVIEEAHRLLKNVSMGKSEDIGNPQGKSVEHFTNLLAEMRSYGQGVIVAEQIPSKISLDVIKNSSNKIVHRVVSRDDQAIIANTIGLKEEDVLALGNSEVGYTLCHKSGMKEPVVVKIDRVSSDTVTDASLYQENIDAKLLAINKSIVGNQLPEIIDIWAVKALVSLMYKPSEDIIYSGINSACEKISKRIQLANITLIPGVDKKQTIKECIKERIISLMVYGVFSRKSLPDNSLVELINKIISSSDVKEEDITKLHESLDKYYGRETEGKVIEILAGLSAPEYSQGYDMNRFIQDFELTPDAELSNAVIAFLERRKVNATN
jgi:hypothetical protein